MFFTPAGKQYTAADAADPDFYRQYLAPYSVGYPGAEPFGEARADAVSYLNGNLRTPGRFNCDQLDRLDSSVVMTLLSVREVWLQIPGGSNRTQCHQHLATAATFLRSCVSHALTAEMGPAARYTLRRNNANIIKI